MQIMNNIKKKVQEVMRVYNRLTSSGEDGLKKAF